METHQPHPTADDEPAPWETISAELTSLGDLLKKTYRRVAADGGPSEDEIESAFATLIGAWDQVAASVASALGDPETRRHLTKAAGSLAVALGATLTELGDDLGDRPAERR